MSKLPIADLASEIVEMEVNNMYRDELEKYYREHRFDDLVNRPLDEVQSIYSEYEEPQQFTKNKANTSILLSGNTEILTLDIRKDKTFKELFNEYRKKENPCGG